MDYRKTAQEIYDHIGKKENIISAAHCATRLRLVIADNAKADKEYVENIEGVKGVFFAQGQMQIILGTGVVNKVYDEFIQIAGVSESSKEDLKKVAASRANPVQRLIKTLGDIFVYFIYSFYLYAFLYGIVLICCFHYIHDISICKDVTYHKYSFQNLSNFHKKSTTLL